MNSYQAKQIPLDDVLLKLGHKPVKTKGTDIWYTSPLRNENSASFKVNKILNTWYDFGISDGGTIIDLFAYMYSDDVSQALARLENDFLAQATPKITPARTTQKTPPKENPLKLVSVDPLSDSTLTDYICKERKIHPAIAKQWVMQICFRFKEQTRTQLALGFKNNSGDWEFRKENFKGFIGNKKDITTINLKPRNDVLIFEGVMDFLSYLTYKRIFNFTDSAIVLNSTMLKGKARSALREYGFNSASFYLDNDNSGRAAFEYLSKDLPCDFTDESTSYTAYDDFNDFLCNKPKKKKSG